MLKKIWQMRYDRVVALVFFVTFTLDPKNNRKQKIR